MQHILRYFLFTAALFAVGCTMTANPAAEEDLTTPTPLTLEQTETPTATPTLTPTTTPTTAPTRAAGVPTASLPDGCVPRADWTATYTVQSGDTLASIARSTGTTFQTLAVGNCLPDANALNVGQVLRVPTEPVPPTATPRSTTAAPFVRLTEITIDQPATGYLTVRGDGQGLFEGNVVVEVKDANGTQIIEQPTTLQGVADVGGYGTWQIALNLNGKTTGGDGTVRAYSTSPRDGSVISEEEWRVTFDYTSDPLPMIDIAWSEWDTLITPDQNGLFALRGGIQYPPSSAVTVRVRIRNAGGQIVSGTERTATLDEYGNWSIQDMRVPAGTVGGYEILAEMIGEDGAVVVTDSQTVSIVESVANASAVMDLDAYTITYPSGWYSGGDAGFVTLQTFPPPNYPPKAAMGGYITVVSMGTSPVDGEGRTLNQMAAVVAEQLTNVQQTQITLNDGTPAVTVLGAGGTGAAIYQMIVPYGDDFLMFGAEGNIDIAEPVLMTLQLTPPE